MDPQQTTTRCISDADMHYNWPNGEEQVKFPYVLAWVVAQIWSQRGVELLTLSVQQSNVSC